MNATAATWCERCGTPIFFVDHGAIQYWQDAHGKAVCGTGRHRPGHKRTDQEPTGRGHSFRPANDGAVGHMHDPNLPYSTRPQKR